MPADTQSNAGDDLIRIHRVITRALKVSLEYSQGATLLEADRPGFGMYVRCLHTLLEAHHAGEDELSFPFWRIRMPDGPFDLLSEQHRQMTVFLEQIQGWLGKLPAAWELAELNGLHATLEALQVLWLTHIGIEEPAIGPENSLKYLTSAERENLGHQLAEHGQAHSQPGEQVMPFLLYNLSDSDRREFSKTLPPVIVEQLVPFAWKAAWEPMKPFLQVDG